MNVNYVPAQRLPDFDHYGELVDRLARGDGFITTGEVLLPEVKISGAPGSLDVHAKAQWTFPLHLAEIVWSDGSGTHRSIFPLDTTPAFHAAEFNWKIEATNWKWARLAVWDVAGNGAFVNPVWR